MEAALLHQQLRELERSSANDHGQLEPLQRRIEDLLQHCANVDAAIASAPNAVLRSAMIMRYQLGMKWQNVASNCGGAMLADAIRKRVHRFLRGL